MIEDLTITPRYDDRSISTIRFELEPINRNIAFRFCSNIVTPEKAFGKPYVMTRDDVINLIKWLERAYDITDDATDNR